MHHSSSGDTIRPNTADAAATAGFERKTRLSGCPILPTKFLFVVAMAVSPFASIPICPPRHGPHVGVPILECPDACNSVEEGDTVNVSLDSGIITVEKDSKMLKAQPVPEFMQMLLREGGLMNYVKKKAKL
ncbi:unnamed protein product [marine sediment metagenome]|uniref:Uncharacterized protein n=1 Tax=marine sediment metagenome TaxID=412755 RepID=X1SW76_9ZZZZ